LGWGVEQYRSLDFLEKDQKSYNIDKYTKIYGKGSYKNDVS
jgi:hypothetical protein